MRPKDTSIKFSQSSLKIALKDPKYDPLTELKRGKKHH
jgi:hypothetical protein